MQLSVATMDPRLGGGGGPPSSFPRPPSSNTFPQPSPLFPFGNKPMPNLPYGSALPFHPPTFAAVLPFSGYPGAPIMSSLGAAAAAAAPLSNVPQWSSNPMQASMLQNSAAQHMLMARLEHHKAEMERIQQGLLQIEYKGEPSPTSANPAPVYASSISRPVSPQAAAKKRAAPSDGVEKATKQVRVDGARAADDGDATKAGNLRGERRLVISFENFGKPGGHPQTFGKSGAIIPDGICGTHTVYNERWKFEINHSKDVFEVDYNIKCVPLTWTITNLTTGVVTSMTESRDEAIIRNTQGQTISNKVFREALESRARDLEQRLQEEINPRRVAQLQSLIRALRPKRFSEGPLIFGLQHKVVQERMVGTAPSAEE